MSTRVGVRLEYVMSQMLPNCRAASMFVPPTHPGLHAVVFASFLRAIFPDTVVYVRGRPLTTQAESMNPITEPRSSTRMPSMYEFTAATRRFDGSFQFMLPEIART